MSASMIKQLYDVAKLYYRGLFSYRDLQRAVHDVAGDRFTAEDAMYVFRSMARPR